MYTGTVKFYDKVKGFGFIVPDDQSDEVFVNSSGLSDDCDELDSDDEVEYEVKESSRGLTAINVSII